MYLNLVFSHPFHFGTLHDDFQQIYYKYTYNGNAWSRFTYKHSEKLYLFRTIKALSGEYRHVCSIPVVSVIYNFLLPTIFNIH